MNRFSLGFSRGGVKRKQRGLFSTEFSIVLLVAGVLLIAAIVWYIDSLRKTSIDANVNELTSVSATAKKKYGQLNQYANVTSAIAVTGQIIPVWLRDGAATTATNSFGGAITVVPATLTGADDSLNVAWPNVPKNQCSDIILGIVGSARQIQVGGVAVKATDAPVNIATVEAQCDAADVTTINMFVGRS
jgi:Tfp pilus assembly protein PilE